MRTLILALRMLAVSVVLSLFGCSTLKPYVPGFVPWPETSEEQAAREEKQQAAIDNLFEELRAISDGLLEVLKREAETIELRGQILKQQRESIETQKASRAAVERLTEAIMNQRCVGGEALPQTSVPPVMPTTPLPYVW